MLIKIELATSPETTISQDASEKATEWWTYIGISLFCSLFAGAMSGLTVGLLSIDMLELEIKEQIGSEEEKKSVKKIIPVLKKHHWLLVTLLFCNAMALEALPIFLDKLVPSHYAILISVVAVLIVGEVIP